MDEEERHHCEHSKVFAPLRFSIRCGSGNTISTEELSMRRAGKIVLIIFGVLLLAVLIVPLIVPIPPLENTVPLRELADPDSQFVEINELDVHYKEMGEGDPRSAAARLRRQHLFLARGDAAAGRDQPRDRVRPACLRVDRAADAGRMDRSESLQRRCRDRSDCGPDGRAGGRPGCAGRQLGRRHGCTLHGVCAIPSASRR